MPHPTLAPTIRPFAPTPVHEMPMRELVDQVGGVSFEVWIPEHAQHVRLSPHEVLVAVDGLQMLIALAADQPADREVAQWRASGAIVLRCESLVDGYLVTALGDRCLDVTRLVRHPSAIVRLHVHVILARRAGWQPQSAAEALCASLQIR